jgi:hypothetical protein
MQRADIIALMGKLGWSARQENGLAIILATLPIGCPFLPRLTPHSTTEGRTQE